VENPRNNYIILALIIGKGWASQADSVINVVMGFKMYIAYIPMKSE